MLCVPDFICYRSITFGLVLRALIHIRQKRLSLGIVVATVGLDLDCVIMKTNLINYCAMLSLFATYPDQQPKISNDSLAHGGIPRREKLRTILRDLRQTPPTAALLTHDLQRYASVLEDEGSGKVG